MPVKFNTELYPELVEAVKNFHRAQRAYLSLNLNNPSEFLSEQDKIRKPQRLYHGLINATREVERWREHYGITYSDALSSHL